MKKFTAFMMALLFVAFCPGWNPSVKSAEALINDFILGDTDGDDLITVMDVTRAQRYLAGYHIPSFEEKAADTNQNGTTDIIDCSVIQRYLADIQTQFYYVGILHSIVVSTNQMLELVRQHQTEGSVSFVAVSDAHYSDLSQDIIDSVTHSGQVISIVTEESKMDFGVVLGDNGWQDQNTTLSEGLEQIKATNRLIDPGLMNIPNFRTPGNHCSQISSYYTNRDYHRNADLYPLYGAYNTGAVFDEENRRRGYCYRDFEDKKLRVITLNTSDLEAVKPADYETHNISPEQLRWLVNVLDVSEKTHPEDWQILILGHAPLDFSSKTIAAANILNDYVTGKAGSVSKDGETISYDFSAQVRGSIIAEIHGHIHDYKVDYLRCLDADGNACITDIIRIAVPNACFGRNNQYNNGKYEYLDIEFGDDVRYKKISGTTQDTALCVFTIDLDNRIIYADHYGAGIDRVIPY